MSTIRPITGSTKEKTHVHADGDGTVPKTSSVFPDAIKGHAKYVIGKGVSHEGLTTTD